MSGTMWFPEPRTGSEVAEQVVATDVAGQVEAAVDPWAGHLTAEDERVWR